MEKPYIECKGITYEFEANYTLAKKFRESLKAFVVKLSNQKGLDKDKFEKVVNKLQGKTELSEEELSKDEELVNNMLELSPFIEEFDVTEIYELYCFKMLETKYNTTKEEWKEILNGLSVEYGFDNVSVIMQKVCEKVFMPAVEETKPKKTLPNWIKN